jgi:hypothetical protein
MVVGLTTRLYVSPNSISKLLVKTFGNKKEICSVDGAINFVFEAKDPFATMFMSLEGGTRVQVSLLSRASNSMFIGSC